MKKKHKRHKREKPHRRGANLNQKGPSTPSYEMGLMQVRGDQFLDPIGEDDFLKMWSKMLTLSQSIFTRKFDLLENFNLPKQGENWH